MLPEIGISVDVAPDAITFRFAKPMSILSLVVVGPDAGTCWEFVANEMKPVQGASVLVAVPLAEAPPELLALLQSAEAKALRRVEESGPIKEPTSVVVYGDTPAGYRDKTPGRPLEPGRYRVMVFAEQGRGSEGFIVPAA